jgi:ribosome-binding protein aMBF1 (putative translation factor)
MTLREGIKGLDRGLAIAEARRHRRLSRFQLGRTIDLHPNSIMYAERGVASEETMTRLEAALGLTSEARP